MSGSARWRRVGFWKAVDGGPDMIHQLVNPPGRGAAIRFGKEGCMLRLGILFAFLLCLLPVMVEAQPVRVPAVVLREGEVRFARQVLPGEPFLSLPTRHTRTGILQNEIYTDGPAIGRNLFAPAGSKAIWLGFFVPRRTGDVERGRDVWCFVPPGEEPSINRCAWGRDAVFVNPIYATEINESGPAAYRRTLGTLPIVVEEEVEIIPDLRLTYVLNEWRENELQYSVRGGGFPVSVPLEADGAAIISTIVGPVRLVRGAGIGDAIVEVSTGVAQRSAELDREIVEFRTRIVRSRPYPVIVSTSPAPMDANFRPVQSGEVLLEQEVRAATVFRADQTLRDGVGDAIFRRGDILAEHESGDGPIVCPIDTERRSTSCFRNADDAPGYDYTYSVLREEDSNLYLRGINQAYVVNPVRIQRASDAVPPTELLRLTYLGVATSGSMPMARFSWTGAAQRDRAFGPRSIIALPIDQSGTTRLTTNSGETIGEFRFVGGHAMYRNLGGIPESPSQPISREGVLAEMLRAFSSDPASER